MKKKFLSLVAAIVAATATYAQGSLVAVLGHEGNLTSYYGAEALVSALEDATNGDVITLSSGQFNAADITKAVTIRGAGMEKDDEAAIYPTVLAGNFSIDIPKEVTQRLTMEGLYCDNTYIVTVKGTLKNATFMKCRFYTFTDGSVSNSSNNSPTMQNISFVHCKIARTLNIAQWLGQKGNSVSFVNCVVAKANIGRTTSGNSFEFTNCVVLDFDGTYNPNRLFSSCAIYRNCILATRTVYPLDGSNHVYRTVGVATTNIFSNLSPATNSWYYASLLSDVFKTCNGTYTDTEDFELTDEAKAAYLGDDGSEVGIHGGSLPFSPNLTSPTMTKFVVAPKSTADGKLSVDIEVKAGE